MHYGGAEATSTLFAYTHVYLVANVLHSVVEISTTIMKLMILRSVPF